MIHTISQLEKQLNKQEKDFNIFDWFKISYQHALSETFITKHKDSIIWFYLATNSHISEDIIQTFADEFNKIEWERICIHQTLSESFISKHLDKISWEFISSNQTLSESFIEKHFDKLSTKRLIDNQELSFSFLLRHMDNIDIEYFWYNNTKANWSSQELQELEQLIKTNKLLA